MSFKIEKNQWKQVRLDDIVEWYQKDIPNNKQILLDIENYITAEHIESDVIKITRSGLVKSGKKGPTITKHYQKGDLLLSTRSVALRKASITQNEGVTGEKLLVLRPKKNSELIVELFPFIFKSSHFWNFAQNSAAGSVNKFTSWTKIKEYQFLLPPKDQQAKIAELLWAMDDVVEKEKEACKKLEILRDSYKQKNLIKYRKSIENDLSPNYEVYKLEEVAEITGGSTPSRKVENYWNGEIPWLTPTDVTKHKEIQLGATKEYITKDGLKNISNKIYPVGSILFCSRATIGFAIINSVPMATNQGFSNFICNSKISNYFLYFLLKHCTPELTRLAGGSTFLEISKASIRRFKIVLPNKEIMHQIEKYLLNIYNLLFEYEGKIQHSKQLQKSLINEIFSV